MFDSILQTYDGQTEPCTCDYDIKQALYDTR